MTNLIITKQKTKNTFDGKIVVEGKTYLGSFKNIINHVFLLNKNPETKKRIFSYQIECVPQNLQFHIKEGNLTCI